MRITILGAGAFGTALHTVLEENHHEVNFYDPAKFPDLTLSDTTAGSEALVLATPSNVAPSLLSAIQNKSLPLIVTTKGLLGLDIFQDFPNFSLLSGGSFAKNLTKKQPTVLTATSQLAADLFQTDWLKVEESSDALGVLLCGSLKNIYAIGSGEQALRPNTPAFRSYIDSALAELKFILTANECNPHTAELACGKLDLVMTCASEDSRNYQFGIQLKKHNHIDLDKITATTEGLTTIQNLSTSNLIIPPHGTDLLHHIIERTIDATK